jgi:RNA polymerase sigma factor (sigma-70 family)
MRLNDEQRALVEANMGLVGQVIKDKVRNVSGIGVYTYDDLFQIGCEGLCKAAATYIAGKGKFSTYAYMLIRNEIFNALEYATLRKSRERALELDEQAATETSDVSAEYIEFALDAALAKANGVTAKGIEAIRLLAQGYSNREIGTQMGGASANNVTAWVARARKFLRADAVIAELGADV